MSSIRGNNMYILRALPTLVLGDLDGHPFRGNQYTSGSGVAVEELTTKPSLFSDRVPPSKDDPAPGGDYEYHGTSAGNLKGIIKDGLKGDSYGGIISTTPHLTGANFYAHIVGGRVEGDDAAKQNVLLRMKRSNVAVRYPDDDGNLSRSPTPDYDHDETREHAVIKTVPAKSLEVYYKGSWHPLA